VDIPELEWRNVENEIGGGDIGHIGGAFASQ
jgi:hypothetical protein